uniref:PNPLA domain-containing protein n=1 Tax=Panagrolaimus sp. ES5 TaxID=591445 RepID=A0AC34F0F5_9BILA
MAPSSKCAHELTSRKKIERIQALMSFIKTATPEKLSSKLVEVWATPQCSITDARILLTLGANPSLLYDNDYGKKTLQDRVDAGSVCSQCAIKFEEYLEKAVIIYDAQFHTKPIHVNNGSINDGAKKGNMTQDLIALSLDGGGMRGLVSVVCLLFTSRRLFGNESLVDKIDWFVGCSTGAMLALALAKGFTLTEAFFLYWEMKNEIFLDKSTMARLFGSVVDKQTIRMDNVLKRCFPCEDDTFQNCARRLTVPALNISCSPAKLHTFRNYPIRVDKGKGTTSENGEEHISFRDAARASSAAPTYFHPHVMGDDVFVDGSLVANCPLSILFREYDKSILAGKDVSLGCIFSIGTGEPLQTKRRYKSGNTLHKKSKYLRDVAQLLMEQVVGHEKSAIEFAIDRCAASTIPFFRVSPVGIDVRIDQIDDGKLMDMIWETLLYLVDNVTEIDEFGKILKTVAERPHDVPHDSSRLRSHTVQ